MRSWYDTFDDAAKAVEILKEKFGLWPGIRTAANGRFYIDVVMPPNKWR